MAVGDARLLQEADAADRRLEVRAADRKGVVQRVPIRIYFDETDKFVKKLKAGMSVYATIDTGHKRSLAGMLGLSATASQEQD